MATATIYDAHARRAGWGATIGLAALTVLALGFVIGFALPYFGLDQQSLGRYWARRGWLLVHVLAGTVALLIGPIQLWLGLHRRRMWLHRRLGLAYMVSGAVSVISAFALAFNTSFGWVFGLGLAGLGVAWLTTTGLAFAAIRRHLIQQHQEWMIRSYIVTFGFVTFRIAFGLLQAMGVGTTLERLTAASWLCWAVPLLIGESILQGKKIFAAQTSEPWAPISR